MLLVVIVSHEQITFEKLEVDPHTVYSIYIYVCMRGVVVVYNAKLKSYLIFIDFIENRYTLKLTVYLMSYRNYTQSNVCFKSIYLLLY